MLIIVHQFFSVTTYISVQVFPQFFSVTTYISVQVFWWLWLKETLWFW